MSHVDVAQIIIRRPNHFLLRAVIHPTRVPSKIYFGQLGSVVGGVSHYTVHSLTRVFRLAAHPSLCFHVDPLDITPIPSY